MVLPFSLSSVSAITESLGAAAPHDPNSFEGIMELSRRDLMKYGVLGSAALLLPIERVARTQLRVNDRMPASGLPKPYTLPFQTPPVPTPLPSPTSTTCTCGPRRSRSSAPASR